VVFAFFLLFDTWKGEYLCSFRQTIWQGVEKGTANTILARLFATPCEKTASFLNLLPRSLRGR
jgi:hypothetical protein